MDNSKELYPGQATLGSRPGFSSLLELTLTGLESLDGTKTPADIQRFNEGIQEQVHAIAEESYAGDVLPVQIIRAKAYETALYIRGKATMYVPPEPNS